MGKEEKEWERRRERYTPLFSTKEDLTFSYKITIANDRVIYFPTHVCIWYVIFQREKHEKN